jgi:2-oxoisovalerate dehydrogenase E1 component alpha subunit
MIQNHNPSYTKLQRLTQLSHPNAQPLLSPQEAKKLRHCWQDMLTLRYFDQQAILLHRTGQIRTYPSCQGQEALSIGLGHSIHPNDIFCSYYRDHGTLWKRGATWMQLLLFWAGCEQGNLYANACNLPLTIPIASQCAHAVGAALAAQYKKTQQVTFVTLGDGATSKGDFYESINFAGLHKLPVVFVINNNQWAISTPCSKQTATPSLAQKAVAANLGAIQCDGFDVLAVIQAAQAARKSALSGQPVILEALTYRLSDHTTCDQAATYRDPKELAAYQAQDPLKLTESILSTQKILTPKEQQNIKQQCATQIQQIITQYNQTKAQHAQTQPQWYQKETDP